MDLSVITQIRDIPLRGNGDGRTVVAGPGLAYLPDSTRLRCEGVSAQLPDNPANGWWYAYGYSMPGGSMGLELTQAPPDTPYLQFGTARCKQGDASRRFLGQGLVIGGKLRAASHIVAAAKGNFVLFDQSAASFVVPATILSLTSNVQVVQTTSLALLVPANATAVRLQLNNMTNGFLYLQRPSVGAPASNNRQVGVQPNNSLVLDLPLDSDLSIATVVSATNLLGQLLTLLISGGYSIEVGGYFFDR